MSIDDEIDEVIEKIDEIEKFGWTRTSANPVVDLDKLRDKLKNLKAAARDLEREKDHAKDQASGAEFAAEEIEEKREALDALYQKALYVLGRYGVPEHELHHVRGHESLDELMLKFGQQPAVRAVRSAIAAGRAAGHQSCAYAGTCLDYDIGLADQPCAAGVPRTKGRFGTTRGSIHAQCQDYCFPFSLGWVSEEERCK